MENNTICLCIRDTLYYFNSRCARLFYFSKQLYSFCHCAVCSLVSYKAVSELCFLNCLQTVECVVTGEDYQSEDERAARHEAVCHILAEEAVRKFSADNVSVMLVDIREKQRIE